VSNLHHAADSGGNVSFLANTSAQLSLFKGVSTQFLFNCLAPNDPPLAPTNGLPDYRNCQVRVFEADLTNGFTVKQAFLHVILPGGTPGSLTVTDPNTSQFAVPSADANGTPAPFDITATGLDPNSKVWVQQCDGVDPTSPAWSRSTDCDPGSIAPSPAGPVTVTADAGGTATFPASDAQRRLAVFKGASPLSLYNCLAPHDPASINGLSDYRTCEVHVFEAENPTVTPAKEAFFSITLPDATGECGAGAGIAQPAKPPKNAGLIKVAKPLSASAAAKDTKLTISGTLEHCENFPTVTGTAGSITNGSFKATLEIGPGSSCTALANTVVKGAVSFEWDTPDPTHPEKLKKVATDKASITGFTSTGLSDLELTASAFGPKSKLPGFPVAHATFTLKPDENGTADATACAAKGGLKTLHFSGLLAPSAMTVVGS
jgi:hypothetical protein